MVHERPPMRLLASRTMGRMEERRQNSRAAVRPAGPAPMMIAVSCPCVCIRRVSYSPLAKSTYVEDADRCGFRLCAQHEERPLSKICAIYDIGCFRGRLPGGQTLGQQWMRAM